MITERQREVYEQVKAIKEKHPNRRQDEILVSIGASSMTYYKAKKYIEKESGENLPQKRKAKPVMETIIVQDTMKTGRVAVVVCGVADLKDVLNKLEV
jgi:hypothetical protein